MTTPSPVWWPAVAGLALLKLAVHLFFNGNYGYFRDELYFIACGRHLDWGYVDHPPLIAIYARLGEWIGSTLREFRLPVAVAGSLRILLTGIVAARLGGGRFAQALACVAVLLSSMYLAVDSILTMNTFEHLYWLGCLLIMIEIANGASEKWWMLFGAVAGLGLQNKHSMLFLGAAVVLAMLLTPLRRSGAVLRSPSAALSLPRVDLPDRDHRVHPARGQGLLRRSDLSRALRGRGGGRRALDPVARRARGGLRRAGDRMSHRRAARAAHPLSRALPRIPESPRRRTAQNRGVAHLGIITCGVRAITAASR